MLRVALQGSITEASKLTKTIKENQNCIVSGVCLGFNYPEFDLNREIDHPFQIFKSMENILEISDAVIFLDHNEEYVPFVKKCLKESRHVFIKPATFLRPETLMEYSKLAEEAGVIFYLFHKPPIGELRELLQKEESAPEFIDIYRYVNQNGGNSNEVINGLFQELLFLHSITQFSVKKLKLTTVPYCSERPFIINLRIEFSNASSANLTINTFTGLESRFSELYFTNSMIQVNTNEQNIHQRFWQTGELIKYNHTSGLKNENNPTEDIREFLNQISKFSIPVNNYKYGQSIYNTFWDLLKQINPVYTMN